jgi:hypothetical protein
MFRNKRMKQRRMKESVTITALSLILFLRLGFSGYAETEIQGDESITKQIDVFKLDPMLFRLSLSHQNNSNIYPLFTVTDNRYTLNEKNPYKQMENKNLPLIVNRQPKKNGRLGNSLFTASLITFTALNIADYVTTVNALQLPGVEEGNPLMRPFTKNMVLLGAIKLGISTLDFYLLKGIYKKNKALGWIVSIAANLAMSYVVSHNIHEIQAVSGR